MKVGRVEVAKCDSVRWYLRVVAGGNIFGDKFLLFKKQNRPTCYSACLMDTSLSKW